MTSKGSFTALLDANVLYSAAMRDVMMEVALAKLYRPRWTLDIQREWIDALLANKPHLTRDQLERTQALMFKALPTAIITGYEHLIDGLTLPDPNDRHVLAAAIAGQCDVIVTQNLRDFPKEVLKRFAIEAQHPDAFLANHLDLLPGPFCMAIRAARLGRKNPPYNTNEYLAHLTKIGLVATASLLQQYIQFLD